MTKENFSNIFLYLSKENIHIDRLEFEFQVQSHPDFPSLLAISDTLSFFKIDNIAFNLEKNKIKDLPERFITLQYDESTPLLNLIELKGDDFYVTKKNVTTFISLEELEERWSDVVFLVQKAETTTSYKDKINFNKILIAIIIFLGIIFLLNFNNDYQIIYFLIFPFLGLLFSIAALKEIFGTKIEILTKFCNFSTKTSCTSIINSKKWKIFKYLSFADLSIIFFSSQIFELFISLLSNRVESFFVFQKILLFSSVPIIILSIYFQKFIEKKWCPICIFIITLILIELSFILAFEENITNQKQSFFLFLFIKLLVCFIWFNLKNILVQNRELKEFQLKSNRFIRNYSMFKNSLILKGKVELPHTDIVIGNKKSKINITLITNPFCGYCYDAHKILNSIIELNGDNIQIQVILKANLEFENEKNKSLYYNLIKTYLINGQDKFIFALDYWFENKQIDKWIKLFNCELIDNLELDKIINNHYKWSSKNNFNYTPAVFVNGFEFPSIYDLENLPYFINDLISDTDFN